jgi:hypothetical protein
MRQVLIFSALFPPLALIVFVAPETISHLEIPSYFWGSIPLAYLGAMLPAWLSAAMDWKLSSEPTYLRIVGTAATGALITGSIASFMWGGFSELFPALMATLVGAIPAAVCSWLSVMNPRKA